jgi:hypothetical protein
MKKILCLALVLCSCAPSSAAPTRIANISVGPMEYMVGPNNFTDNPFSTLRVGDDLFGYLANGCTACYRNTNLETLQENLVPAISWGSDFDSCGAWLNSALNLPAGITGWYHAERPLGDDCFSPTGEWQTVKSVAYADSQDGQIFSKPDYPNNQVITAPAHFTGNLERDEGDHHVIQIGNYLYMYFRAGRDWQIHLARSAVADGGKPGTWFKYYNGQFSEPGIGGESSPIATQEELYLSWVSYSTQFSFYIGLNRVDRDGEFYGYGLSRSIDGIHWSPLSQNTIVNGAEWLNPEGREIANYLSLISLEGDSQIIGKSFWVYYMYLKPGSMQLGVGNKCTEGQVGYRYLVRQLVTIN